MGLSFLCKKFEYCNACGRAEIQDHPLDHKMLYCKNCHTTWMRLDRALAEKLLILVKESFEVNEV